MTTYETTINLQKKKDIDIKTKTIDRKSKNTM